MKKTAKILWFGAVAVALAGMVEAMAWSPIQVGLFGGNAQVCAPETEITGLRLNLPYSENDDVTGLDLGIVSGGASISGLRLNAVNLSDEHSGGVEIGLVNVDKGEMVGWQCGIFNYAGSMRGFQLGLINRCGSLYGIQIGLVNMIETGKVAMLPIVSWAF
jgi:hypothetical protein